MRTRQLSNQVWVIISILMGGLIGNGTIKAADDVASITILNLTLESIGESNTVNVVNKSPEDLKLPSYGNLPTETTCVQYKNNSGAVVLITLTYYAGLHSLSIGSPFGFIFLSTSRVETDTDSFIFYQQSGFGMLQQRIKASISKNWQSVTVGGKTYDTPITSVEYNQLANSRSYTDTRNQDVSSGSSASLEAVESDMSESYYRNYYARCARLAESAYKSLTSLGIDVKNKKTGEHTGSATGSWEGSKYVSMKSELNKAQRMMKDIRSEAQRAGYIIIASSWETVTVSY